MKLKLLVFLAVATLCAVSFVCGQDSDEDDNGKNGSSSDADDSQEADSHDHDGSDEREEKRSKRTVNLGTLRRELNFLSGQNHNTDQGNDTVLNAVSNFNLPCVNGTGHDFFKPALQKGCAYLKNLTDANRNLFIKALDKWHKAILGPGTKWLLSEFFERFCNKSEKGISEEEETANPNKQEWQ